jgi:peroxiredoxin
MTEAVYALYPVFKAQAAFPDLDPDDAAQEIENLFKEWEGRIAVRGVYSTVGFRPDSDLMLWLIGPSPDEMQSALVQFRRTPVPAGWSARRRTSTSRGRGRSGR